MTEVAATVKPPRRSVGHVRDLVAATASDRQPWEQQPDELDLWFTRFQCYLALGRMRTLGLTYRKFRTARSTTGVPAAWYLAFADDGWRERAAAYDDHQRIERQRAIDERQRAIDERRARERDDRVLFLRATRGKLVDAMRETDSTAPAYSEIVANVAALNEQLRRESDAEVGDAG